MHRLTKAELRVVTKACNRPLGGGAPPRMSMLGVRRFPVLSETVPNSETGIRLLAVRTASLNPRVCFLANLLLKAATRRELGLCETLKKADSMRVRPRCVYGKTVVRVEWPVSRR